MTSPCAITGVEFLCLSLDMKDRYKETFRVQKYGSFVNHLTGVI
jgi:hypothetical protein